MKPLVRNRGHRIAASCSTGGTLPPALLALAISAFGIGCTEFIMMGLLPEVAVAFHVSIPTAGDLISGYALGVVRGIHFGQKLLGNYTHLP